MFYFGSSIIRGGYSPRPPPPPSINHEAELFILVKDVSMEGYSYCQVGLHHKHI